MIFWIFILTTDVRIGVSCFWCLMYSHRDFELSDSAHGAGSQSTLVFIVNIRTVNNEALVVQGQKAREKTRSLKSIDEKTMK